MSETMRVEFNSDEWYPVLSPVKVADGRFEVTGEQLKRWKRAKKAHRRAIREMDAIEAAWLEAHPDWESPVRRWEREHGATPTYAPVVGDFVVPAAGRILRGEHGLGRKVTKDEQGFRL